MYSENYNRNNKNNKEIYVIRIKDKINNYYLPYNKKKSRKE
jgi:hypothetical protein